VLYLLGESKGTEDEAIIRGVQKIHVSIVKMQRFNLSGPLAFFELAGTP
jgi:hypothetical protein